MKIENLRALRTKAGETQDDIAKILDVSNRTISKWETGEAEPDLAAIVKISEHYNVTIDYLIKNVTCSEKSEEKPMTFDEIMDNAFYNAFLTTDTAMRNSETLFNNSELSSFSEIESLKKYVPQKVIENKRMAGLFISSMYSKFVNSDELNYSVNIFRNYSNFEWMSDKSKELSEIFAWLAKPEIITLLRFLLSEDCSDNFTVEYISEKTMLPVELIKDFFTFAKRYMFSSEVEFLDGIKTVYRRPDASVAGLWMALCCIGFDLYCCGTLNNHGNNGNYCKDQYIPVQRENCKSKEA